MNGFEPGLQTETSDRDLRFVRINDQLAEITGLSVEANLGRTVTEVLPAYELV